MNKTNEETIHEAEVSVKGDDAVSKQEPPQSEKEEPSLDNDLAFGYVVGVKTNGALFFQMLGEEKGIVQLLGVNQFARRQIETLADAQVNQGVPFLAGALSTLTKELREIKSALSGSKEPNNKL